LLWGSGLFLAGLWSARHPNDHLGVDLYGRQAFVQVSTASGQYDLRGFALHCGCLQGLAEAEALGADGKLPGLCQADGSFNYKHVFNVFLFIF